MAAESSLAGWNSAVDNQFDFNKKAYLEATPALAQQTAVANTIGGVQGSAAATQGGLAQALTNRVSKFTGMQDKYAAEAFGYNSPARQQQVADAAVADVAMKSDNLRQQSNRQLERSGVPPGSGKQLSLTGQLDIAQAKNSAGAANKAVLDLDGVANERQKTAIGMGATLPQQASVAAQTAGVVGNQAINAATVPLKSRLDFAGGVSGIYGAAADGYKGLWSSQNLTPGQQAIQANADRARDDATNAAYISAIGSALTSKEGQSALSGLSNWFSGTAA